MYWPSQVVQKAEGLENADRRAAMASQFQLVQEQERPLEIKRQPKTQWSKIAKIAQVCQFLLFRMAVSL